jgi:acetyltransferase-like isoleucine patch superfamily enzyme
LISHNVNIIDTNSHELNHLKRANDFISLIKEGYATKQGSIVCDDIVIEDYAWINFNAVIQKGVRVGKGAIIAPSSVVTEDVEAFTLVGGNPAKFIKYLEQ